MTKKKTPINKEITAVNKVQKARAIASLLAEISATFDGDTSVNTVAAMKLRSRKMRKIGELNGWGKMPHHNTLIGLMDEHYPGWRGYDSPIIHSPNLKPCS